MTLFRSFLVLGIVLLAAAIGWALSTDMRPLGAILADMAGHPWTVVTLIDLYFGFFIAAAIILMAERSLAVGVLWALPILVLGNLWTALWLIIRLPTLLSRLRAAP